ncbi:MAG TPA: acetyl-CoA carboxylase biotin carboxyl carrier protein [Blastocatellia bacterium]|nr:acetyl-CoA carboxylase biotin carboxyl carrier protein [Blastocatellia bacterium]
MKKTERTTKRATNRSSNLTAVNNSSKTGTSEHLNLAEIKELIELISEKQFNEFELECDGFRLRVQKSPSIEAPSLIRAPLPVSNSHLENHTQPAAPGIAAPPPAPVQSPAPEPENLHVVPSPIVGTFYRSPSPTAEPFVKLGAEIEAGQTLCIIEAMKLMNEINSDVYGRISKIYVENGQPVEYGQPLFGIQI